MEIWKDIKGYEGIYKVSNLGNIISLPRPAKVRSGYFKVVSKRILKNSLNNTGYYRVNLRNGKPNIQLVHRLVCNAFHENKENKRCVNHKNGIKTDNRVENLEWATDKENFDHSRIVLKNRYTDRRILRISTGDIYESLRFAVLHSNFSKSHLCAMLNGDYPNKSDFVYIESDRSKRTIKNINK